jgi:branched-chain amino acid transport system permease protein
MEGLISYGLFTFSLIGIYGILALGLNVQWGMTGLFNIGIAAFFAVGAYTTGILTGPPSEAYVGGFQLPLPIGLLGAIVTSGILAFLVGLITLNLRADYLAIASIGIAEIVRLFLKTESWLTGGVRGMEIAQPFKAPGQGSFDVAFLILILVVVAAIYVMLEVARRSPWGRVLRGIRENEDATLAAGKNVVSFRLQAFVLGSCAMGLGGAVYAHFIGFVSPEAFRPMLGTFLVWVMLIAGGSGNNKGALLGALVIWLIWSGTEFITGMLPPDMMTRGGALRILLIGVLLEIILITRPEGILSEASERRAMIRKERRRSERAEAVGKGEG